MICLVALVVFGILGVFSAKYRSIAKQAFDCVFRRMTLRPCNTGFDQRMKVAVTSRLYRVFPRLAGFTFKHFEALSWVFTLMFFASLGYTAYSFYNLYVYGTCDPAGGYCPFKSGIVVTGPGNTTQAVGIIEFFSPYCTHCVAMKPVVAEVEAQTGVKILITDIYTPEGTALMEKYWPAVERDCAVAGTPAFYSAFTGRAVCGEMSAQKLAQFVLSNCHS